jgi:hypothetical protein
MPDWLLAPICLVALFGFIGYAYYQGMRVSPDRDNTNVGAHHNSVGLGGPDGHSGS